MFEYMTVQDAAKLWGISVRRVQKLCEEIELMELFDYLVHG